ncbi:MAG: ferric reductase-like transmembrane domain-containing protein [Candidatus Levyibacteriota bacterium]
MNNLIKNIRFYVLAFSGIFSLIIYLWVTLTNPSQLTQIIELEETYGLLSIVLLYITLLAGPLCYRFKWLPFKSQYLKSRRALGVATFYFAFLHTLLSFFGQLGGFSGLGFLNQNYIFAILFGFIALIIFFFLTITSLDIAVEKMSFPKWKLLHRFIYLGGILVLVHIVLLGSHYLDLSESVPLITFVGLVFLLILEEPRLYNYIRKKIPVSPIPEILRSFIIATFSIGVVLFIYSEVVTPLVSPNTPGISFDVHAGHRTLAQQALDQSQQQSLSSSGSVNTTTYNLPSNANIPELNGDRTKRYTVSMSTDPVAPQPNQPVTIHMQVYDAGSGNKVTYFKLLYTQFMHLIVVNSDLTYFNHTQLRQDGQEFVMTTQFPKDDLYHLYIQFQPLGGIEQQMAFTLPVGSVPISPTLSKATPDSNKIKTVGPYNIAIDNHGSLQASALSQGSQKISITIRDAKTNKPLKNLKPYLGAFGHLTLINEKTFDFVHVHPYDINPPLPDANGGPTVDFLPRGIYGPFKPGIYRGFVELNPDNALFTSDFTVKMR